jgi:hypothetical protein
MKYVLMDTNIYLDLLVDRRKNVSSALVSNFKKLLDFDEIKLIVPRIVVHEVRKHIEEQLIEVGKNIHQAISSVEKIHDIHGLADETLNAAQHRKEAKKQLTELKEKFENNKDAYLGSLFALIDAIFNHKNCIIIEDDDNIRSLCLQRKIYKKAPFHIDGKESFADGTIAVTLIKLKEYIEFLSDDSIYFVTGNTTDFSEKEDKRVLHKDIVEDLALFDLDRYVTYVISFNELVGKSLKAEVESANLQEEFDKDLQHEVEMERTQQLSEFLDERRKSVGLSSLSGFEDMFLEDFSESDFVAETLSLFERINICYDELEELFYFYEEDLINYICSFEIENIDKFIKRWNSIAKQVSFPEADDSIGGLVEIVEYIKDKSHQFDYSEINSRLPDYMSYGKEESFFASGKKQYTINMEELFLSCQEGDVDWLELSLIDNNQLKIATGTIEITYGYVNFNSEGNVDDSCDESIDYYTSDIENELLRIVDEFETWVIKEKEFVEIIQKELNINS